MLIRNRSLLFFVLLAACGGKLVDDQDGGDAAPVQQTDASPKPPVSDADPPTQIDASNECNTLDPLGKPAPVVQVAADPPPLAGTQQSFGSGVYVVTSVTIYTGPNGPSGALGTVDAVEQLSSAKNGWLVQTASQDSQALVSRTSSTLLITGPSQFHASQFCPTVVSPPSTDASFAFSGTELTLRVVTGPDTVDTELALTTK